MLSSDLLKALKAKAKSSILTIEQRVSDTLMATLKPEVDLNKMIRSQMINHLAEAMIKKSSLKVETYTDNYSTVYKAQVFGFSSAELDKFIEEVYMMGYEAKDIL